MEHDLLGLDEFVMEAEKGERDAPVLLPIQEELAMGTWAIQIDGIREGRNPLAWTVATFYIYGQQDFIAMSAIEGSTVEELTAKAEEIFAQGNRFGRRYSLDNEVGEVTEVPAYQLLPVTEDQAAEVRFYEYRLPIIYGMCDWFEPLIDEVTHSAATLGVDGYTIITCPKCGTEASVRAVINFNGNGGFQVVKSEDGYALTHNDMVSVNDVRHMHLRCIAEDCEYDECIDLNEVYVQTDTL